MLSLSACGQSNSADNTKTAASTPATVQDVMDKQTSSKETPATDPVDNVQDVTAEAEQPELSTGSGAGEYDVDLTALSSTMVYSEVYNMTTSPSDYIGKTVKMKGVFSYFQAKDKDGNPIPDGMYYFCVIADAAACCSQGIEFVLSGEYKYPDDYPKAGEAITVTGTYDSYDENGNTFYHLVDAVMQ